MDAATAKYSQIECRLFFKEEENGHLNNRFSQCQKEIQDWKKSYEEEHIKNETNISKFNMYEETLRGLKDKITETQEQNHRLTQSLQNLQFGSKETRDKLSEEVNPISQAELFFELNNKTLKLLACKTPGRNTKSST